MSRFDPAGRLKLFGLDAGQVTRGGGIEGWEPSEHGAHLGNGELARIFQKAFGLRKKKRQTHAKTREKRGQTGLAEKKIAQEKIV